MTELAKFNQENKTYTSLYLCEQINIFRKEEGRKLLLHNNLLKKIRNEFEEEIGQEKIYQSYYVNSQNKKQPMFELTYEQSLQMLMSESKTVRKGVIEVLKKLKEELEIPKTFAQALQLAADQAKQLELKESKIQGLEQALDTSEQWISIIRAAKDHGVKETFFNWRKLKDYSINNGIEIKKAPCPRFGTKNLYHVSVFTKVYPELTLNN